MNVGARPAVEDDTDTATLTLRFDKDQAFDAIGNISTDGEAVFFRDPESFIRLAAVHRSMWMRFTPFNSSPQETTFALRGLSTAAKGLQKACEWLPDQDLGTAAIQAFGAYSSELEHLEALTKVLLDKSAKESDRIEAARAFGTVPWRQPELTLAPLADVLLTDSSIPLRVVCAQALGSIGPPAIGAANSLDDVATSSNLDLAAAAKQALARIRR